MRRGTARYEGCDDMGREVVTFALSSTVTTGAGAAFAGSAAGAGADAVGSPAAAASTPAIAAAPSPAVVDEAGAGSVEESLATGRAADLVEVFAAVLRRNSWSKASRAVMRLSGSISRHRRSRLSKRA